jgi:hypothetical protein
MSIPSREVLLEVALNYIEHDLLPTLQGEHKFKTRVAVNALRIAQREAAHPARASATLERNHELVQQIRSGQISTDDPALRAYLRKSLREALAINNPKWLDRP